MKILVSACLLGRNCKYSGGNNLDENVVAFVQGHEVVPVCPEEAAGLGIPRVPMEIVDAARVDGSGEFYTFNRIILPMMKPALAVQMIFSFVTSWNNYFTPALILHKDKMKTLPILIAQLRSADFLKFNMGHVYAAIAFSIFPVIVVYLILSKYIVGGTTLGGVKG